jgi:nitronate monooxygenase
VQKIKLAVVAAGSIVDGAGMAAAFSLGASAVYMGTRFIASTEAEVTEDYKNAIVRALCEDIVNTDKVDGFPGNFIRNAALEAVGLKKSLTEEVVTRSKKVRRWIALSRAARSLLVDDKSKVSYKTIFSAGHGVGLIDEVKPIREIMETTVKEYREIKMRLP